MPREVSDPVGPAVGAALGPDRLRVVVWLLAGAALLLAVLGSYSERWSLSFQGGAPPAGAARVGDVPPPFQTRTLSGAPVSLDDFRGRVVVLNFWATWCPPCRVEMPELDAYQAEMGDRIAILGIDMGEPAAAIVPFVREYGLRFPILLDETGAINAAYAVTSLPTSVILDRSGIVRERVIGAMTRDGLARRVERLL